jgi:hypothetical protein
MIFDANNHRPHYYVADEHTLHVRAATRAQYRAALEAAWRMAQEPDQDDPEPEPQLSPYEQRKHDVVRAWIAPQTPWGQQAQPKYWNDPPTDPITAVVVPAKINPRKGAGRVTEAEIAAYRAAEQAAFRERLFRRWQSNVEHL